MDLPDPAPGPGEVVVEVHTAAMNRLDVLQRQGPGLLPRFTLPHVGGMDAAGVVAAAGDGVPPSLVGQRVLVNPAIVCGTCASCARGDDALCSAVEVVGGSRPGGFARLCVVPAANVRPLPDDVTFDDAATIPTAYSTAWRALRPVARLQPGQWLVVHAAASGVSAIGIQIAARLGARGVATASSEEKLAVARRLGAEAAGGNRSPDWVDEVREITGGGAHVVFDHVGPALFQGSLDCLRPRGKMVFCGATTGAVASFRLPSAYQRGLQLLGVESYSAAEFDQMLAEYWRERYTAVVDSSFELADLAAAHERLESGRTIGKVLIHVTKGPATP